MMQQVAAQNTDIAAFGTTKVPELKVKDNASEQFSKVFNDENWGYAKPVSPVSRANGESHKIDKAEKATQGDKYQDGRDGKAFVTAKHPESTDETAQSDLQTQSAEHPAQVKSDSTDKPKQPAVTEDEKLLTQDEEPVPTGIIAGSADNELLSSEQQSHSQLMDFIAKLQSQQWRETEVVEKSMPLLEALEEKPQTIPQSLLNTLMAKLKTLAADEGSEVDLTAIPEKLDDKLLTKLISLLAGGQTVNSSAESSSVVEELAINNQQEESKADLELLSILLLPASSEQVDNELPVPLNSESSKELQSELAPEEDLMPEQLQLNILLNNSNILAAGDKQAPSKLESVFTVSKTEVSAEGELPESLQDISIKAQLELDTIAPVNKLVDNQTLKTLLNVPEKKLEQVLTNLAQRIVDEQAPLERAGNVATVSSEQDKQLFIADFVTALKAGVDEFKQQLKQGREPGIDLKALVAEAPGKVSETSADNLKDPLKLEQLAKSFSQIVELGQNINSALEQQSNAVHLYDRQSRGESNQLHIETAKSQTMQQVQNSQFDKAVNINKPEGHQQLAEKVQWMVSQKNMLAEIRLDPAELGSMSVKVNIQGDAASVSFVVQTQHARDALEQAVPRLREMLAEKGIALGQSSVQQESKSKQDGDSGQAKGQFATQQEELQLDENTAVISQRISNGALGGIDYFV